LPSLAEIRDTNRLLIESAGDPPEFHFLEHRGAVESAIEVAEAYWNQSQDIAGTVARLSASLSKHQPFRDTNHRTAFVIGRLVLQRNRYGFLVRDEDAEFAAILSKDRDPYRSLEAQVEELTELFDRRIEEGRLV